MDLYRFAVAVVAAYFRHITATRPIDKKVALSEFKGMMKAANRLGLGMTEAAIEIAWSDTLRSVGGFDARPEWRAIDNSAQKTWDETLARKFAEALETL